MSAITVEDAVAATGGRYVGDAEGLKRAVLNVTSDSRTAGAGSLFVCYRGARVDGHDFMADCLKRGAACCLSEREPVSDAETPCIVVDSTLRGIAAIAGWYRGLFDLPVIGITGSVGKTTTKELVALAVSAGLRTMKTAGNANSQIGLPMTVLRIEPEDEAAVVEMGVSMPGEMARIARVAKPTLAVMTNIGVSHIEFMKTRENILAEKFKIAD